MRDSKDGVYIICRLHLAQDGPRWLEDLPASAQVDLKSVKILREDLTFCHCLCIAQRLSDASTLCLSTHHHREEQRWRLRKYEMHVRLVLVHASTAAEGMQLPW